MTREEIIEGLECCDALHNGSKVQCETRCPYWLRHDGSVDINCRGNLIHDVHAMIKAEAPRVLSLEELMGFDGAFLIEYNKSFISLDPIWATFHYMDKKWVFIYKDVVISHYSVEQYGRTWRCWTSRPDPKQMEATPWRRE